MAHKQKDKEIVKGHSKSGWQHLCGHGDKVQVLLLCSPQMLYRYPTLLDKMQSRVNDYCLELAHMTTLSHDAVKITDHVKVSSVVATRHPSLADARCRVQALLKSSQALESAQGLAQPGEGGRTDCYTSGTPGATRRMELGPKQHRRASWRKNSQKAFKKAPVGSGDSLVWSQQQYLGCLVAGKGPEGEEHKVWEKQGARKQRAAAAGLGRELGTE